MASLREVAIDENLAVYEKILPVFEIESDYDTDFSEDDGNPGDAIELDQEETVESQHQDAPASPVEVKEEKLEPVPYNNSKYFRKKKSTSQISNPVAMEDAQRHCNIVDRYFESVKDEEGAENPDTRGTKRKRIEDIENGQYSSKRSASGENGAIPEIDSSNVKLEALCDTTVIKEEPGECAGMFEIKDEPGEEFEVDSKSLEKYNNMRSWKRTRLGADLGPGGSKTIFASNVKFRVLTYNILSPTNLHRRRNIFKNKKEFLLSWEYRFRGLQREMDSVDPDVVCLQEIEFIDSEQISDEFVDYFASRGYLYKGRQKKGPGNDGCAVFYKNHVFECEDFKLIDLKRSQIPHLSSSNVAVICRLKARKNALRVVVGTFHLRFGQKKNVARMAQMAIILADMHELANCKNYTVPCILAADFNFQPFTDVHKLLTKGSFTYRGLDSGEGKYPSSIFPKEFGLSDYLQWETNVPERHRRETRGSFRHNFGFRSAYQYREERALYQGFAPPESEVTAYQGNWVSVDNILYSTVPSQWAYDSIDGRMEKKLKLLGKWSLPTASQISSLGGLPSMVSPSDHLPLAADFLLC